jgi:glycosyltransferase involved in cell wall biosynthesis
MKTKLVYVLVSYNEQSDYLEQCLLSCYSARLHNAGAEIVLLVDDLTDGTLQGKRAEILKYISRKTVINIKENYNATQRSRIIKTTAREYIQGDFLFIDTDTIITQSLAEADSLRCTIGAVADSHVPIKKNISTYSYLKKIDRLLNWTSSEDIIHFNSGVLFVKDTPEAGQFYKDWNKYLLQSMAKGIAMDQAALATANKNNNNLIEELPGEWNCQLRHGLKYLENCKIMHTFNIKREDTMLADFMSKEVLRRVKRLGTIDEQTKQMIAEPKKYLAQQTYILANRDVEIWEAEVAQLINKIEDSSQKIFKFINLISRAILYLDNHYIRIFKKRP